MSLPTPESVKKLSAPDGLLDISHEASEQHTERALKPLVPTVSERQPRMHRDETSLILRRCLRPQHHTDPNVMKFIAEYLLCRSVKQASVFAGLTSRDGAQLIRRPDICEAIRQVTEKAAFKVGFDPTEIIQRTKEVMDVDVADFQRADGTFIESLHEIAPEVRRAVKSFKAKNEYGIDPNGMRVVTGRLISVELWDKLKATELLGRESNLFKETKKVEHNLSANMSSVLLESKARAEERVAEFREVGEDE